MSFKYFDKTDSEITDLSKIQEILKEENIILDSKYLPVMEQAEKGEYSALAEMTILFSDGVEGVKPNYNLAKRYASKALAIVRNSNDPNSILEVLTNIALLESENGKEAEAKVALTEAFEVVLGKFPLPQTIGNISNLFHFIVENIQKYQDDNTIVE